MDGIEVTSLLKSTVTPYHLLLNALIAHIISQTGTKGSFNPSNASHIYLNLHSYKYEDQIIFRLTKLKFTVIRRRYSSFLAGKQLN